MSEIKKNSIQLDKLPLHNCAFISSVKTTDTIRRRLLDLGFVPGTAIMPLYRSPLGDPVAYKIMGAVIALRNSTASGITVNSGVSAHE